MPGELSLELHIDESYLTMFNDCVTSLCMNLVDDCRNVLMGRLVVRKDLSGALPEAVEQSCIRQLGKRAKEPRRKPVMTSGKAGERNCTF